MKILFHGSLELGQQSKARAKAVAAVPGVSLVESPVRAGKAGRLRSVLRSLAWRLRRPLDEGGENRQLLRLARETRPDAVFVENSRIVRASTLRRITAETGALLVFFSPDDIVSPHNSSVWLKETFPLWDLLYTTKSFAVEELRGLGVRQPVLINNWYEAEAHRPMTPEEVGPEYEAFDLVFVGTFEREREESIARLAGEGFSILVHGNRAGYLSGNWDRLRALGVTVRPAVAGLEYSRVLHHGRVALTFLRKINRDLITQRSVELPAMARPMLAEKTDEHDQHFVDGREYVGFTSDEDLVEKARRLLRDPDLRLSIGQAGRARCLASRYDLDTLVTRIVEDIAALRSGRRAVADAVPAPNPDRLAPSR